MKTMKSLKIDENQDKGRRRETVGDRGRQREKEGYSGRQRETEGDRGRQRETEGDRGRRETKGLSIYSRRMLAKQ